MPRYMRYVLYRPLQLYKVQLTPPYHATPLEYPPLVLLLYPMRLLTALHRASRSWISQTCATLMYLDIGEAPGYLRRMKNLDYSFLS